MQPGAFDEAVKDVDAAIHTASPVGLPEGDPSGAFLNRGMKSDAHYEIQC